MALGKVIAEDGFSVMKNVLNANSIDLLIQKIALAANRRVLHLEYSAINLPDGLEWCDRIN